MLYIVREEIANSKQQAHERCFCPWWPTNELFFYDNICLNANILFYDVCIRFCDVSIDFWMTKNGKKLVFQCLHCVFLFVLHISWCEHWCNTCFDWTWYLSICLKHNVIRCLHIILRSKDWFIICECFLVIGSYIFTFLFMMLTL